MTLIGYAHSSQFMEWQNLGVTTLKHAKCATNVYKKFPKNRITADFIYLTSSKFVTVDDFLNKRTKDNVFLGETKQHQENKFYFVVSTQFAPVNY